MAHGNDHDRRGIGIVAGNIQGSDFFVLSDLRHAALQIQKGGIHILIPVVFHRNRGSSFLTAATDVFHTFLACCHSFYFFYKLFFDLFRWTLTGLQIDI